MYTDAATAVSSLIDNFGREINYLRLSITDRCNLRCCYCMPEEGVKFLDHNKILSYEEMETLVRVALRLGIKKVRITGGEPFARKGCMEFLKRLKLQLGVPSLHVTTNGVVLQQYLAELKYIGISGINMSLDTINRDRFENITRRDQLDSVLGSFYEALRLSIPLKINSVIQDDTTDDEIVELAELIIQHPVSLRFIELMPFSGKESGGGCVSQVPLEERLRRLFPGMKEISSNVIETARRFQISGAVGTIGIIEGHSRKFCSTCNKIRITSQGMLKTCLYDRGVCDLRSLLRQGADDEQISQAIVNRVSKRYEHGRLAEEKTLHAPVQETMSRIGG
jgi:cyclic pyranopterin phosphate synthase